MDRKEDRVIIEPTRGKNEPPVTATSILVFSERELNILCTSAETCKKGRRKLHYSLCYEVSFSNKTFTLVGPAMGAPMAVLILEKVIALGARHIIAFGSGGSLKKEISIGDLVIPTGAVSEEGTSKHYPLQCLPEASIKIVDALKTQCAQKNKNPFVGKVWTTDAPYRETVEKVKNYQAEGLLAVDMEMSALFTVARFRKVEIGSLMVISDELFDLTWKSGFESTSFLSGVQEGCEIVLSACASI